MGVLVLSACVKHVPPSPDPTPPSLIEVTELPDAFEFAITSIRSLLPRNINGDFVLPKVEGLVINYRMDNQVFDELFIYHSPFYDQEKILMARISNEEVYYDHAFSVFVLANGSASNLNQIYINLPGGADAVQREIYQNAEMTFFQTKNDNEYIELYDQAVEIRGRGNSTWFSYPKQPYRIRFSEETSIYGMPQARNYVLLAEYADKSLLRNTIVHQFSSKLKHMDHVIQTRMVELYINDQYHGVYTLSEHVESHENKLYIDVNYDRLDAGFFLELDQRIFDLDIPEQLWWFNLTGRAYEIKRPDPDNLKYTQGHTDYISSYFYEIQQALIAQSGYEDLIDVDNFLDYFVTQELFKNVDVGFSSVFMYKQQSQPVKMGPLWDFDFAIGNADYIDYGPDNFYGFASNKNYWFHLMMQIPELRVKFVERYNDVYYDIIPELLLMIDQFGEAMAPAAARNFERWDILSQYIWPNPAEMLAAQTYQGQVDYVKSYIAQRSLWLFVTLNSQAFLDGEYN